MDVNRLAAFQTESVRMIFMPTKLFERLRTVTIRCEAEMQS